MKKRIYTKMLVLLFTFLISTSAFAKGKFWFSNKFEIGYDKIFISEQITMSSEEIIKNSIAAGLKFKLDKNINLRTFCLLENAIENSWENKYFLGAKLDLKF